MAGVVVDDVRKLADSPGGIVEGAPSDRRIATRVVGYWDHSAQTATQKELPSTGMILIISLGPKMRVASPADDAAATVRSFVAGLHLGPAVTEHDGDQEGIQIDLTPLAARAVLGVPLHELADRCVDLDDLLGARSDRLVDALRDSESWTERFDMVDRALRLAVEAGPKPAPESRWLYGQLLASAGEAHLATLVERSGRSHRHLTTQFKRDVGLTPKAFARLVRFRRALRLLSGPAPLAGVAVDAGYYDQAHFTREFLAIAGTTPGRFRADRSGEPAPVDFVQDARLSGPYG